MIMLRVIQMDLIILSQNKYNNKINKVKNLILMTQLNKVKKTLRYNNRVKYKNLKSIMNNRMMIFYHILPRYQSKNQIFHFKVNELMTTKIKKIFFNSLNYKSKNYKSLIMVE